MAAALDARQNVEPACARALNAVRLSACGAAPLKLSRAAACSAARNSQRRCASASARKVLHGERHSSEQLWLRGGCARSAHVPVVQSEPARHTHASCGHLGALQPQRKTTAMRPFAPKAADYAAL